MPLGLLSRFGLFTYDIIAYIASQIHQTAQNSKTSRWLTNFHPDKCNVLSIRKSKRKKKHPVKIHPQKPYPGTSAKYLGVTITSDMKWTHRIKNINFVARQTAQLDS